MNWEWIDRFAAVLTGLGVLFLVVQLRQSQRQRHRQFEDQFLQRYWTLLDSMPDRCDPMLDEAAPSQEMEMIEAKWMRTYLRLCEDQCDMRAAGWVTDETWKLWWEGIHSVVSEERFRNEIARYESNGLLSNLRRGLDRGDSNNFDPAELTKPARWWRGLFGLLDRIGRKERPVAADGVLRPPPQPTD